MSTIYRTRTPSAPTSYIIPTENRNTPTYKIAMVVFLFLGSIFSFLALPLDAGLACGGFLLLSSLCCVRPRTVYRSTWVPSFFRRRAAAEPVIWRSPMDRPVYRQTGPAYIRRQVQEGKSSGAVRRGLYRRG